MPTTTQNAEFSKQAGAQAMRVMDEKTKDALAALGLDATRWDVRVNIEDREMVVKIRIRPLPANV